MNRAEEEEKNKKNKKKPKISITQIIQSDFKRL